jgi:hypothetical protein
MTTSIHVKLNIGGREVEITLDQARELKAALDALFPCEGPPLAPLLPWPPVNPWSPNTGTPLPAPPFTITCKFTPDPATP